MAKNKIKIKSCKKVVTKDVRGRSNGWLLEIVSDRDGFTRHLQGQTYLITVAPKTQKGFHLHALADYYVTCIRGNVTSALQPSAKTKQEINMGEKDFKTIFIPAGVPHLIINKGLTEAYVLVYRYPAWSPGVKEQLDIDPDLIKKNETWSKIKKFSAQFN